MTDLVPHQYVDDGSGVSCDLCNLPKGHPRHRTAVPPPPPRGSVQTPIVRNTDPSSAHDAAARYQPKRETAKGRVLAYMQARIGQWIDAPELAAPEVGGFAGTRRMRELRDAGWPIETRPNPDGSNTWQHRLLPED